MLAAERKKLEDLNALITSRRAQITRLGHRAAAMDIRPYRRLCQVPSLSLSLSLFLSFSLSFSLSLTHTHTGFHFLASRLSPKERNAPAQLNKRHDLSLFPHNLFAFHKIGNIPEGVGPASQVARSTAHPSSPRDQCVLKRPGFR